VRAWFMRSPVFVTVRLAAPMRSSSADAITARQMRSIGVSRRSVARAGLPSHFDDGLKTFQSASQGTKRGIYKFGNGY
jgi:hypothetical protein